MIDALTHAAHTHTANCKVFVYFSSRKCMKIWKYTSRKQQHRKHRQKYRSIKQKSCTITENIRVHVTRFFLKDVCVGHIKKLTLQYLKNWRQLHTLCDVPIRDVAQSRCRLARCIRRPQRTEVVVWPQYPATYPNGHLWIFGVCLATADSGACWIVGVDISSGGLPECWCPLWLDLSSVCLARIPPLYVEIDAPRNAIPPTSNLGCRVRCQWQLDELWAGCALVQGQPEHP